MTDELTEEQPQKRAKRGAVMLLAVALVLAVAVGFALGTQGDTTPAPQFDQGDPFVLLETARGTMPAFVLIHSAT